METGQKTTRISMHYSESYWSHHHLRQPEVRDIFRARKKPQGNRLPSSSEEKSQGQGSVKGQQHSQEIDKWCEVDLRLCGQACLVFR